MTTLKDIAKKANVSTMTVSRVVNGNYKKVSMKTKNKILKIIEETGYVPNYSARSLSSNNSKIIAIITKTSIELNDPYTSKLLASVVPLLQEMGYFTMLAYLDDFNAIKKQLKAWNVEGAIFLGLFEEDLLFINDDNNIPMMFTDSYSKHPRINNVGIDDYKGGVLAANHFISKGHKHFAFVSVALNHSGVTQTRMIGFKDTLKNHGYALDDYAILNNMSYKDFADRLIDLGYPHTAIFVTADIIAVNTMQELISRGYSLPKDYSFIGFDNMPISKFTNPTLTTITQDINLKAEQICTLLINKINNPALLSNKVTLDVSLVERNSVANLIDVTLENSNDCL